MELSKLWSPALILVFSGVSTELKWTHRQIGCACVHYELIIEPRNILTHGIISSY
jgi:hypothetical protein